MSDESQNPAFPCLDSSGPSGLSLRYPGLTKRELFAAMIMEGLCRESFHKDGAEKYAQTAVLAADALIKALEVGGE